MTDKELVRKLLYLKECTQTDLARHLGVDQAVISRVINEKQQFRPATRLLAEQLLGETETQQLTGSRKLTGRRNVGTLNHDFPTPGADDHPSERSHNL